MFYKRIDILINKKFQLRFAFYICTWVFALSMIYPFIIYNLFEYFLKIASSPHAPVSPEKIKNLQQQVLLLLGILQLVFLVITFILSIFLSHRIAGPLYRLRKSMEEVGRGNFDLRITFRKADHFMELQDVFNEMVQHLSVRHWR